jgi:hypothetical protein
MDIRGSRDGYVVLTPHFHGTTTEPSATLDCSCEMAAHRFAGATEPDEPIVRIAMPALHRFVEDLRVLECDRRGTATLTTLPGSMLRPLFEIFDRAGHVSLAAELTDLRPEGEHRVSLAFEVYPTALPAILSDFEELLSWPHPDV